MLQNFFSVANQVPFLLGQQYFCRANSECGLWCRVVLYLRLASRKLPKAERQNRTEQIYHWSRCNLLKILRVRLAELCQRYSAAIRPNLLLCLSPAELLRRCRSKIRVSPLHQNLTASYWFADLTVMRVRHCTFKLDREILTDIILAVLYERVKHQPRFFGAGPVSWLCFGRCQEAYSHHKLGGPLGILASLSCKGSWESSIAL